MIKINTYPLWTACITPFSRDGRFIDYESLASLLRTQSAHDLGIVLFGSTGEGFLLKEEEKQSILTFAMTLYLDPPILVSLPNHDLAAALSLLSFCETLPITGYLIAPPVYTRPGPLGQVAWFEALLKETQRAVMLYNIPSRTGVTLHLETLKALKAYPQIKAIKDSSGSIDSLRQMLHQLPEEWGVFCGDDDLMPAAMALGAQGLVSVASNACPWIANVLVNSGFLGKRLDRLILNQWYTFTQALNLATNPIPIKALMKALDLIPDDTVRSPLNRGDLPDQAENHLLELVTTLETQLLASRQWYT